MGLGFEVAVQKDEVLRRKQHICFYRKWRVLSRARGGLGSTSVARVTFWRRRRAAGRPSAPPAAIFQPTLLCTESATILVRSFPGFERTWRRWGAVRNARSYLSKPRARASKEGLQIWGPLQTGQTGQRARTGVFSGQRA